jgi:hypothetical protein
MASPARIALLIFRVLAACLGAGLGLMFLALMLFFPPGEAHLACLAFGALAGVLLQFARSGWRSPWRAACFLPALYLVQTPAIHLAVRHFPHHRSAHILCALGASALFMLAVVRLRAPAPRAPA